MVQSQESDGEASSGSSSDGLVAGKAAHLPGTGGPVTESVRLLRRNPELIKVILCVGIQMAAADIAGTIDLGPDTNQTWGHNTAQNEAWFQVSQAVVAYATGPIFGRFNDSVDRRIAIVVYGFISFVPTFVYWFYLPLNDGSVVWASHYATIFAAIGRSANVDFALCTDVTAFEDRALASGLFYGLTNLLLLLLSVLPAFLVLMCNFLGSNTFLGNHPYVVLMYQGGLVVLFVVCASFVAKPEKKGAEDAACNNNAAGDEVKESKSCSCICVWVDDLRLVWRHERLLRLMLAAFFLSVCGTISTGNDGQFFSESLHLYEQTDSLPFDQMNILRSVGSSLIFTPAYILAGYISMSRGTLKVLRWLVPVTAIVMSVGGFTVLIPKMWIVPVIVAVQNTGELYQVPLMRMAAGVARPGRVGTWLTLVGMAFEAGNILGGFAIILFNSIFCKSNNEDSFPLWIYYPVAGAVAMLALLSVCGVPKGQIGWGSAAGTCKEQFAVMMLARRAGLKLRARARARHEAARELGGASSPPESGESDSTSADSESDGDGGPAC
mmetsp:Transcript_1418/g.4154  ORF Transcript_1418/g.4154 Transcript_1418/m.4154 type:complete len:552 (-) Transcript_1418:91-1746(-)